MFSIRINISKSSGLAMVMCLALFLACVLVAGDAVAEYKMPPKAIADLADAPLTPSVILSPDYKWIVLAGRPGYPSISVVSEPELRLGGIRINPRNNGRSRTRHYTSLTMRNISDGSEHIISGIPENAQIGAVSFSPDGKNLAFTIASTNEIKLWVADLKSYEARLLSDRAINPIIGGSYDWLSDSKTIIAKVVPSGRGDAPSEPAVPDGPTIQQSSGRKAAARTYQDLLKNKYDEDLFDYLLNAELLKINLDGKSEVLGSAAFYNYVSPSPDGKYLLVGRINHPYSYTVPYYRFARKYEVWDTDGNLIKTVADLPLAEEVPIAYGSVSTGHRSISWRSDVAATLYWTEAQDDGDAAKESEFRDEVFTLKAPFDGEPESLIKLNLRYSDITWGNDNLAIASEYWWKTRQVRTWLIKPGDLSAKPELLNDRSWEDRYADPGSPLMKKNNYGRSILRTDKKNEMLYLVGTGASPEGDRPFVDEYSLKTKKSKRLFHSEAPYYERPVTFVNFDKKQILTRRESITEPPNYFLRDLNGSDLKQVTNFKHPTPQLLDVQKEMIHYKRADGVPLTATLYLPAGYKKEDGPLPMLMWAYPIEYKSAAAAGQVQDSPYRFVRVSWASPMPWLAHGYAVLDDPIMPIIGEGDTEPNDTFREQLVSSAKAAVDEVVRRGVADPDRIAIGGHSYGAFMTANLLSHSDLFRAGIARSGAYNRTLTPFGFQSEERTYWQAPEIYYTMSPFMHADKMNEPLVLIHGEADNNSGTFPLQSKRYYAALKGHGANVRLVMLPHESHGYRARESVMHMLWEMTDWLDTYVKNAGPRE